MLKKGGILQNIQQLNKLYSDAPNQKYELYYAKLALIELCGWVEESSDDIIRRCAKKHLKDAKNIKTINGIIKTNYGFQYDEHFKKMLMSVIGLKHIEKLEKKYDPICFVPFEAVLKNLKDPRNSQAHTHISGVTLRIDAPSVTEGNFHIIFKGLKDIEVKMRSLNLL